MLTLSESTIAMCLPRTSIIIGALEGGFQVKLSIWGRRAALRRASDDWED